MSEIVKAGTYNGRGISADYGMSSTGKDYVRVALKINGGEFDGRTVSRDLYLSEKATEHTVKALRALGCTFPGNDITNLESFGATEVSFTVEHENYEKDGETRTVAKIGFINSLAGGIKPEAQMNAAQKAALKARLMGTLAATAPKGNGAPKAGGTPPPF